MDKFSKRNKFYSVKEKEIIVRDSAPEGLRWFIKTAYYDLNKNPSDLRSITTKVLKIPANKNNWSQFPNIDSEVELHLEKCEWYLVYDIIEAIIHELKKTEISTFTDEINEYFIANGIGWKLVNGHIETRGENVFEEVVKTVELILEEAKLPTAKSEIREALLDLSRRPKPDITGAIQHSLASLECVAREVCGDSKLTLGEIMKKYPAIIPKPLDEAIIKIWGFTSEHGRHLKEGRVPEYLEAEIVVEVTSAISSYLGKKLIKSITNTTIDF